MGRGSQTASSQTSRVASGWEREAAEVSPMSFWTRLRGELEGEESTRTREALGVVGLVERGVSKRR